MIKINKFDKEIIKLYTSGEWIKSIGRKLCIDPCVVKRVLLQNNIEIRKTNYRKYIIQEDFFDHIDTQEKSYMLGFLYADGAINPQNYNIAICLSEKDRDILEKFTKIIFNDDQEDQIVSYVSKQKPYNTYSRININSKHMFTKLCDLGCVPQKSLILKFPDWLKDSELQRHFIRGYFDGDGCIHFDKGKYFNVSLNITSTLNMIDNINIIINDQIGVNANIYKYKNVYRYALHGSRKIQNVLNYLYKDSSIYLNRKFQSYLKLNDILKNIDLLTIAGTSGYKKNKIPLDASLHKNICNLYSSGANIKLISNLINLSPFGVKNILIKNNINLRSPTTKHVSIDQFKYNEDFIYLNNYFNLLYKI